MRLIFNLVIFFFQCFFTFLFLLFIYTLFALLDYPVGIEGIISITVVQPILGALLSGITIAICLVIGLPIRLSPVINSWWKKKFLIAILGTFTGIAFLIASFYFMETYMDTDIPRQIPNLSLALTGWFMVAFFLSHTFSTENVVIKIENYLNQIFLKK
ncbi:MAG TPA: hypothetical protein VGK59_08965 [Ohtaekwangia sp.]